MKRAKRPTIGFLSANINTGASRVLWPGILDAAIAGDANVICYPGGRLRSSEQFEDQRNFIFDLVEPQQLSGLVSWTSALAGTRTPDGVADFHRRYQSLPIVSLGASIRYGSSVSIDGYQGMRSLVSHLIETHGFRRIALLRGPEEHPYALERHQAYIDELRHHGIAPDPEIITPSVKWEKGADAIKVLLDERHLIAGNDFQAVVAASDLLAIGALNVFVERGIRIPADVAVVGFNDIEEGRLVRPPLTSVSLPFYNQGYRAVETLLSMLTGEETPEKILLESRLLIRQSCGCTSKSVNLAAVGTLTQDESRDLKRAVQVAHELLVEQIVRVISNRGVAATWAKLLIDAFCGEINREHQDQFQATLDSMLKQGVLDGDETDAWQSVISVLRREILPTLNPAQRLHAEDLCGQARVLIGEAIQRAQIIRQVNIDRQNHLLRDLGQALITTFDMEKISDVLAEQLPNLGIHSCYLSIFENPAVSFERSRMFFAYSDGKRLPLEERGRLFPSIQLVPAEFLPARRFSLVVEPLYFQTEPIGFVLFEIGPRDGDIYEVLRGHLSSALKGALLFSEADDARRMAERADQIKTRLLANVSHELRTPLNIIIGHSQRILDEPPPELTSDIEHIQHSAEHQLRIINDLLDLSRAEINALDLYPSMLDPRPLLEEAFAAISKDAPSGEVAWRLDLPDQLPVIEADPVRLRQILLNLLSNAAKFTRQGQVTLGAELAPPHLHIWVADTGVGIPPEVIERIYEPFFTHQQSASGIGLGLSITRHLISLHKGLLELESQPGEGSAFHVYLPLLSLDERSLIPGQSNGAVLWLISNAAEIPDAIREFSQGRGLAVQQIKPQSEVDDLFSMELPSVVAWDMADTQPGDWTLIRRLHNHPKMSQIPLILFQGTGGEAPTGLTSVIVKPAGNQALWESLRPALMPGKTGSILIVDDNPQARQTTYEVVMNGLPEYAIRTAEDGAAGLCAMQADPPSLVILDLMMPDMDGFEVLDHMRADERTRGIPVIVLSGRQLSINDVKRLERHAAVTLQSKGILSEAEMIAALNRSLFQTDALPSQTSALVKQAVAYLHQSYSRSISRLEMAEEIGVNEDYLTRVFKQELGISPWDYLNRYRIFQARERLTATDESIGKIGYQVGFSDVAYFSRVFRRQTGMSPSKYRESPDRFSSFPIGREDA